MTLLDDRPATAADSVHRPPPDATPNAWRFAFRLAGRETRRRPGRTLLAALLIVVPVMAMTVGSVLARTDRGDWSAQFERRYGTADIAVDGSYFATTTTPPDLSVLPDGTEVVDYLWTYTAVTPERMTRAGGSAFGVVTDIALGDPSEGHAIEVTSGSAPKAGEILLDTLMADLLGVDVGDELTLLRPSGTWTVSGIGRHRDYFGTGLFVIPDLGRDRIVEEQRQTVTLYDLPEATPAADVDRIASALGGVSPYFDPFGTEERLANGLAWGWVAGVLALIGVGIIVAAAFATSARRQLVTIGQLTANGATPTIVRRVLALQGTWTGILGAAGGIIGGFAVLPFARPWIERVVSHDVGAYQYAARDLVVIAVTAVLAGTVAAAVPARSASRIPVMAALSGRRPQGRPPRHLVPVGIGLLGSGLGLIAIAALGINGVTGGGASDDLWLLLVVLGVVGVVFGVCCSTPLVVARIGGLGARSTLSWRLALRSLARSRTRSSAVIAAIAVAVGGAVAAATIVESVVRSDQLSLVPTVPADAIVIESYRDPGIGGEVIDLGPLPDAEVPADLRDRVLSIVPGATVEPLFATTVDPPEFDPSSGGEPWPIQQGPRVASTALLDVLGLSDGAVALLERRGALHPGGPGFGSSSDVVVEFPTEDGTVRVVAPTSLDRYRYDYAGWSILVTEPHARELGFDIIEVGLVVRSERNLTADQRDELRAIAAEGDGSFRDAFLELGDPPREIESEIVAPSENWSVVYRDPSVESGRRNDLWVVRGIISGAALLLTLLVVGIGLSLAASEGRDERSVLAVIGARPSSLRRQAAARATVLASTGIVLGVPTGFVPAWVLYRIVNSDRDISAEGLRFPWLVVGGLVAAVPFIVALAAWTSSGIAQRLRPVSPGHQD